MYACAMLTGFLASHFLSRRHMDTVNGDGVHLTAWFRAATRSTEAAVVTLARNPHDKVLLVSNLSRRAQTATLFDLFQ